jgi:hypothetical protein
MDFSINSHILSISGDLLFYSQDEDHHVRVKRPTILKKSKLPATGAFVVLYFCLLLQSTCVDTPII